MTYRERRERKAERLREWADKREARSDATRAQAQQLSDMIPFGQPILVGHHSERRHRNGLDRIDRKMQGAVEDGRKASEFRSRANNIEAAAERAIYSDDEGAAEQLRERIAELEAARARIKAYNATCRKGAPDASLLDEAQRVDLAGYLKTGFADTNGAFPKFKLTNLGGNISRNRKRLAVMS